MKDFLFGKDFFGGADNNAAADNTANDENVSLTDFSEKGFSYGAEKKTSNFVDWTKKIRFDRSFTAKLILADEKVKNYYALLATELLSYNKVKSKTSWSGVSFTTGRERFSFIAISGKTLCLYLALEPQDFSGGKYKPRDVGDVKSKAKTPALLKIKSDGALKNALKLIAETASKSKLSKKENLEQPILASNFKTDTFNNLITRGLIRVLRRDKRGETDVGNEILTVAPQEESAVTLESIKDKLRANDYEKTIRSLDEMLSDHPVYKDILSVLAEGNAKMRASEKFMMRAVDEIWVRAVEDCVTSLDTLIRLPNHFISETEEVLPIELTKRINGRSVVHLAQHTDYLSKGDDGEYTPTKMLNIFREDSLLTYENKFLNTLINRLYIFVNRRYRVALERGANEKLKTFEFENDFTHGEGRGKIKISVEYSESNDEEVKNVLLGTGLWKRVERLNDVVTGYLNSSFARAMDKNFVRPPIMRTNAIVKNKYFRECLALWEFIESYNDAGYGITVDERNLELSDDYVKQSYLGAATLYLSFRHNLTEGYVDQNNYSVMPEVNFRRENVEEFTESFEKDYDADLELCDYVETALRVAMFADDVIVDEEDDVDSKTYKKSFHAKLRLADEFTKNNFVEIANELLKYQGVKMRHSKRYATFNKGRTTLARMAIGGKTIKLYVGLKESEIPLKVKIYDFSDTVSLSDTPSMIKVKSLRGVKYAKEVVGLIQQSYSLTLSKKQAHSITTEDYKAMPVIDMIACGWIQVVENKKIFKNNKNSLKAPDLLAEIAAKNAAEDIANLSATESPRIFDEINLDKNVDENIYAEKNKPISDTLENIIRPSSNYSKPTEYGIDDSAEFIKDSENSSDKKGDFDFIISTTEDSGDF